MEEIELIIEGASAGDWLAVAIGVLALAVMGLRKYRKAKRSKE